jgi:hypothetical protein
VWRRVRILPPQSLRVVRGDKNGTQSQTRRVRDGYWSSVTWPVSGCTVSCRPVLSSERAPYRKNNKTIVTKERIRSWAPKESPIPGRTGRLTVGRKINSTQLSRDSAVATTTGYGLKDWRIGVRVSLEPRTFNFPCRPNRLWGPLNLLFNEYRSYYPEGTEAGEWSWLLTSS